VRQGRQHARFPAKPAQVIAVDEQDRVKLSRKRAMKERGETDPPAANRGRG